MTGLSLGLDEHDHIGLKQSQPVLSKPPKPTLSSWILHDGKKTFVLRMYDEGPLPEIGTPG